MTTDFHNSSIVRDVNMMRNIYLTVNPYDAIELLNFKFVLFFPRNVDLAAGLVLYKRKKKRVRTADCYQSDIVLRFRYIIYVG